MSKRILVVEDQEDDRRIIAYLEVAATNSQRSRTARERLQWMAMRRIPIIAVTSHAPIGEEQKARAVGYDDFMLKPFVPEGSPRVQQRVVMWIATMLLAAVSLVGCAQYEAEKQANMAAAAQARVASDDANCRSFGAQPGSPEYEDCRKRFANQHAQETHRQDDLADQMLNANKLGPIGQ